MMKRDPISREFSLGTFIPQVVAGSNSWLEYYSTYFNFGYFTCCTPFRFKLDGGSRSYFMDKNNIQKVFSAILNLSSVICIVTNFRKMQEVDFQKNPLLYIELASVTLDSIYLVWVLIMFWTRSHVFLRVFQNLESSILLQFFTGSKTRTKILSSGLCLISFCQAIISVMYKIERDDWSPENLKNSMTRGAKYMFMLNDSFNDDSNLMVILTVTFVILSVFNQLLKNFADLIGIISVVLLRHIVNDILHAMKDDSFSPALLQVCYDALKDFIETLNEAVGIFIFFIFLGPVPYYSINIVDMLDAPDQLLLLSNCIYLFSYFITLILAARVNKKSFRFKHWLDQQERYERIPQPKLVMILHDISADEIGLMGQGYFTATSGLVGTITSLILTYAIIVVQFRSGGSVEEADTGMAMANDTVAAELQSYHNITSYHSGNFTAHRTMFGPIASFLSR